MYANLEAENDDMHQRMSVLERKLADEEAARTAAEKCAASERSALDEQMYKHSQLQTAQQVSLNAFAFLAWITITLNPRMIIRLVAERHKQVAATG